MATQQLTVPGTAGATAVLDTSNYYRTTVFGVGLAAAETVAVTIIGPSGTPVACKDESGAAVSLTATAPSAVLVGGPTYQLVLSTTAGNAYIAHAPCSNNG